MTGGTSPAQGDRKGRICVTCVPTLRKRPGVVRPVEKKRTEKRKLSLCRAKSIRGRGGMHGYVTPTCIFGHTVQIRIGCLGFHSLL